MDNIQDERKYWALSYGVKPSELYTNFFAEHKVSISYSSLPYWYWDMRLAFSFMFTHLMYLIINDVIEDRVIFKLPQPKRSYIEMVAVSGDEFTKARQNGAFLDVDFLASNFTGYNIIYRTSNKCGKWAKRIYVTRKYKLRIAELTNLGVNLTSTKQKTLKDYIDRVKLTFPYFTKLDIEIILGYGLRNYAWANLLHCDVALYKKENLEETLSLVTGILSKDSLKHYYRWITKWRMKERLLYKSVRTKWDGYYYIGFNDQEHLLLLNMGKYKTLHNIYLTKVKKEFRHLKSVTHVWRVPWPVLNGWKFFIPKLKTDKLEYVGPNKYELYHQCFLGKFKDGNNG